MGSVTLLFSRIEKDAGLAVTHVAFLSEPCRVCRDNAEAKQGLTGRQGTLYDMVSPTNAT
jgi:hypothetical protein